MPTIVTAPLLNAYVGKKQKELWIKALNSLEIMTFGRIITDVKSKMLMLKMSTSKGARPYRPVEDFSNGDFSFSGTEISTDMWKRDFRVDPAEFLRTPMEDFQADRKQIPMAQRVNEGAVAQVADELNETSYFGVGPAAYTLYTGAAVTAGSRIRFVSGDNENYYRCITNAAANESPATHSSKYQIENNLAITKGLGTLLAEKILSSEVAPYPTGITTTSNTMTKVQEMWGLLSDPYKKKKMVAVMSETTWAKYKAQYRSVIHNNDGMKEVSKLVPDCNENLTIVNWSAMSGSNRIILTEARNFILGTNIESDFNDLKWKDTELHYLKGTITGLLGFTFHDLSRELFVTNDAP